MQKVLLLLLVLVAFSVAWPVVNSLQTRIAFETWTKTYNKLYSTNEERESRYNIWLQNAEVIRDLSIKNPAAKFGHTKFGDLSPSEFAKLYLTKRNQPQMDHPKAEIKTPEAPIPASFDWRDKNAVTPVKDQGQCGSCWAFSVVETIESQWFLSGHPLLQLSPQQIVDCDVGRGDEGCNGGDTPTAYAYVIAAGGLDTETQYPYTAEDGTCAFKTPTAAKIRSWKYITQTKNETEMQIGLVQYGPLSICVDAASWQFYVGGVITSCADDLDHCVQITGYGVEQGWNFLNYNVWKIRNSWGQDWGYSGYLYVERGYDLCGVADEVTIPIV